MKKEGDEKCKEEPKEAGKKDETAPKKIFHALHIPKEFPPEVKEFLRANQKDEIMFYSKKVFEDFDWSEIKRLNIEMNTKPVKDNKHNVIGEEFLNPSRVIFFPNTKARAFVKGQLGDSKESTKTFPIISKSRDSIDPKDVVWLDENVDKKKVMKIILSDNFHVYSASVKGDMALLYSKDPLDTDIYDIEALHMPQVMSLQDGTNIINNRYLVISKRLFIEDYSDVMNKKFPSITSITPVWDYATDTPIYDEVESFIMLSSAMFMILGFPAIGLILCGGTHARKTAWLESFREIFQDLVILMHQQASVKSILVSHFGDKPTLGMAFRARYVTLIDEFMRGMYKGSEREGKTIALLKNCSEFMNVIEHKEYPYGSGKGTVFATLKSSFIATDNTVFKEELKKAWKDDPASLRRFTFLQVSKATEERGKNMTHINSMRIPEMMTKRFLANQTFPKGLGEYAKFFRYGRKVLQNTVLTTDEQAYIDSVFGNLKKKYRESFEIRDTFEALFMCYKFWTEHIENIPLKLYEDACERIYWSHKVFLSQFMGWKETVKGEDPPRWGEPFFFEDGTSIKGY